MINICGITYTHTSNFGSCLQAYALQTAIENSSYISGEQIRYHLIPIGKLKPVLVGRYDGEGFSRRLRCLVSEPIHDHYRKPFEQFEKEYMHFADCTSYDELSSLNEKMDAFVCGSDVIWNPKYNHGVGAFFLDFATKYSFSYAASFGGAVFEKNQSETIGKKLSRLASISVRENQGIDVVGRVSQKQARVDVDPVLLLDRNQWNALAAPDNRNGKYIFAYSVGKTQVFQEFLNRLKKQTGLKVIKSASNANAAFKAGLPQTITPQRWLQLIRDAEYVVTNSFHGTAFSILFHKTVFVPVTGELNKHFNVRMYNLLSKVGLLDRMFNEIPDEIDLSHPNYFMVDEALKELKSDSLEYIRSNLEAAYEQKQNNCQNN